MRVESSLRIASYVSSRLRRHTCRVLNDCPHLNGDGLLGDRSPFFLYAIAMTSRQITVSTLWQIASQVVMAGLSIITVKFVAIGLSLELAGEYNSAYGYLQLFGILADFGLYAVAVREVSKAENKAKVLGALMVLRCITLALSLGAALLFVWIIPSWRGTPLPLSVSIASLVPACTLLAGVLRTVFQVHYRMGFVFIAEVIQRIVAVALIAGLVWSGVRGSTDTHDLFLMLGFGSIGALVLLILSITFASRLTRIRPSFDRAMLTLLATQAVPYGVAFFATALYRQFDVTLLALLRPDYAQQNAYYGFVQRIMDMAYLFPTFLLNSTLPQLATASHERVRSLLSRTLLATLLLSTCAGIFAALWARPIMQLLTTDRYLSTALHPGSDTALQILSISMFANGIIVFCFYVLLSKHIWRPLVETLAAGALLSLALNIALIPSHGFVGASMTSALVHVLLAGVLLLRTLRAVPFGISMRDLLRLAMFIVLLSASLFFVRPLLTGSATTALFLAIGGVLVGVFVWGTGLLKALRQ